MIKLATLATAIADALRRRGVPDSAATLAAEAGIAVFKVAYEAESVSAAIFPDLIGRNGQVADHENGT